MNKLEGSKGESTDMLDPEDLSEQELETLRGDAVGDNLCSSKWIISTLMSLCEVNLCKSYILYSS